MTLLACREAGPMERGREYTRRFYSGDPQLVEQFGPKLREHFPPEALEEMRAQIQTTLGLETKVEDEELLRGKESVTYGRTARFSQTPGLVRVEWRLDGAGRVKMFRVLPMEWLQRRARTDLRLPFLGRWRVSEGGHELGDNYHPWFPEALFAYDFVRLEDDKAHRGDGALLEEHYCFGSPVLAPAAGRVVHAVDGVPDNPVGVRNPDSRLGNQVVIEHAEGERSTLLHLKQGSLKVREGQEVAAGDDVGACGNSGNSRRPHIHYHLTDAAGHALPARFRAYRVNGELDSRGAPSRDDILEPEPKPEPTPE
jgi:hypothetical protein